jgi:hypothetical protein
LAVTIRRLEEFDDVENFDCGDEPLNNYLKRHAWTNQQKSSIGVTYVALDESAPRLVLGYFTLATSSVPRDLLPKKYVRGATSIRPAVDLAGAIGSRQVVSAAGGLGHAFIAEAFKITLRVADEVGCRCIITDAYRDRVGWYAKYGFIPIEGAGTDGPRRCFWTCDYPAPTLRGAIE